MSDVIFIAGYYRSGTSALSGVLHRLGVSLHNDADANEHNPLGFYEIPELIEFDVDLFARLGVDWTDIRGLAEGWMQRADVVPFHARLDEILRRRFSTDTLWGVKHPHLCRLLPLYEQAACQAGHKPHVIHICRDPWTVAASQRRKNELSRAHALLLWAGYMISAEKNARHLPRSWMTYQNLLANPQQQIERVERDTGLQLLERPGGGIVNAQTFLTKALDRSEPVSRDALAAPLRKLVTDIWDAIQSGNSSATSWNQFAADAADITMLLTELGNSRCMVMPGFGAVLPAAQQAATIHADLRPAERTDAGAQARLLRLAAARQYLPSLTIVIAVPTQRAHAITETIESLRNQWHKVPDIRIVSTEAIELAGHVIINAPTRTGALTEILCEELNKAALSADYVAILNAGDTVSPDACLRFALTAAAKQPDMIYCDEIVPGDRAAWVRFKPAWDITRLGQSAYIGDWAWYRGATILRLGGFDPAFAGVEEYELQLRLAEAESNVERLPEVLFTRAARSRRDNIPATVFGPRAIAAVSAHFARRGIEGEVHARQHLGLFSHIRTADDPGTSLILLCDDADVPALDRWMQELFTNHTPTGPVILAGASLTPQVAAYLARVVAQAALLHNKLLAVAPEAGLGHGAVLRAALDLATTVLVAVIDVRGIAVTPDFLSRLRGRLADPGVAMAGGRALVALKDAGRCIVHGPVVIGADNRLGAGHLADDPGPGGWLAVDQESSTVAPPILLARRADLAACCFPALQGDALWIDLCAQLRQQGRRIVWTPDVSFVVPNASIRPDPLCQFRDGTEAMRQLGRADPYHHPALSLRGDLLAAEQLAGIIPATPADQRSLLLSGPADEAMVLLNAARALRAAGEGDASWAPDQLLPGEVGRRAASRWVRINPADAPAAHCGDYIAVYTRSPSAAAKPALTAASALFATSPSILRKLRALAAGQSPKLWRPALSLPVWAGFQAAGGLNTKPRVLWVDEGFAPPWMTDLINDTMAQAAWIVVERPGAQYSGAIAHLAMPPDEQGWARELSALAPHILLRPADQNADADHYITLLAAAAGCHLLVDSRLDVPVALKAVRLPNQHIAWQQALRDALADLGATLNRGARAQASCLAMPGIEASPPPWALAEAAPASSRRAAA